MEESYAAHRRRKAAAAASRRREKTPASDERRSGDEEATESPDMDEDEERRARMERMVEDTERMEERRSRTRSPGADRRETASPRRQEEAAAAPPRSKGDNDTGLRRRMASPEGERSRHLSPSSSAEDERLKRRSSSRHRYDDEREQPRRSAKKQIIPLSDDSLYEDVVRAKRAYAHRVPNDDYEYEEDDEDEVRRNPKRTIRKRKTSIVHTDEERDEISKSVNARSSWYSWIPFLGATKQNIDETIEDKDRKRKKADAKLDKPGSVAAEEAPPPGRLRRLFASLADLSAEFREFCRQNPEEVNILIELRNLCIAEAVITFIVIGLGGLAFRFTEGAFETFYKCGVKRVKRDFLDSLWNYSHNMKEDDWKSMARRKLMEFEEQLHDAHEAGVQTYSGQKNWTFLNACVYCFTVITSIGYGHIYPNTTTGRALTIVYAIFGIPMFLIVLADFGKMFTRGIKFLWAFVRRLYYTGSCRKMRRTVPMQGMMKGVQAVYDFATFRRPSQMTPEEIVEIQRQQQQLQQQTTLNVDNSLQQIPPESPSTPAMSAFEIDDEFNLPISVAITILVFYIFIGATAFNIIEDWGFFDSFYFVFISMSTIGFGDFVPNEPLWMMLSIVYLIFGLALTSMCINVVQVMLTDQFKQASQKIGATIGFQVSEEDGSLKPSPPDPVEVAEVHNGTSKAKNGEEATEKVAPKAKQDVNEL
ncbi:TWiK family of potassium channels protein 7 [Phymastichus coffea]|uniref:TWiK family of potassium channels protein 7 n=1 Tax=Phymastichus coffea TaxID=108790 RepID=UPI00273B4AFC|nr:TWiK family of potassium channels protein 7 [Phymastichus coffea]